MSTEPIKPLDSSEQQQLVAAFQAFMQLPNADILTLKWYADASGSLCKDWDELVLHWHDLEEAEASIQAYGESLKDEEEEQEPSPENTTTCYICGKLASRIPVPGPLVCENCKAETAKQRRKEDLQPSSGIKDYWLKEAQ